MTTKPTPPILFIVFNRPENTKEVFRAIRESRPRKLYIASDAPRKNIPEDRQKVSGIRTFLLNAVDWECDLKTLFHPINQGCKYGPQNAITWFFENEDKGVVLEDDCVPSDSFFRYTSELLDYYEHDLRVFGISGINFQSNKFSIEESYYFSKFFMTWGWASWKTRWEKHLSIQQNFEKFLQNPRIHDLLDNKAANKKLLASAKRGYFNKLDAWDYQWILSCIINNGLIVTPAKNLIQNIGFGDDATHTILPMERDVVAEQLDFPLIHPKIIIPNLTIDNSFYKNYQGWLNTKEKLFNPAYLIAMLKTRLRRYF